jgi:hypothetical protein
MDLVAAWRRQLNSHDVYSRHAHPDGAGRRSFIAEDLLTSFEPDFWSQGPPVPPSATGRDPLAQRRGCW